jgi:hypothetical protein
MRVRQIPARGYVQEHTRKERTNNLLALPIREAALSVYDIWEKSQQAW